MERKEGDRKRQRERETEGQRDRKLPIIAP